MNRFPSILAALLLALPAVATARPLAGDATRGAAVFRAHCASCHGYEGRGGGALAAHLGTPAPAALRDPAFLLQRTDEELTRAVLTGGRAAKRAPTMPAFAGQIAPLDLWDAIAFLRQGEPSVAEAFPGAARYTAKSYTLDADSQRRLEPALGKLGADEGTLFLLTVYGGERGAEADPSFVPPEPRLLDTLKPKQKLGYMALSTVALPGLGAIPCALVLDKEGVLRAVVPTLDGMPAKERPRAAALLAGFEGQGGKRSPYPELKAPAADKKAKKPEDPRARAETAKTLSRAYLRAVEAAVLFDRDERDRHWAD